MGKKSSLMTPDPYHIPGYGGYIPQFKYRIGKTFGNHTHSLLRDSVSCGYPILGSIHSTSSLKASSRSCGTKAFPISGNLKYVPGMVPGYTGYIPKSLNYFGSRYTKLSHLAISEFKEKKDSQQSQAIQEAAFQPTSKNPSAYTPEYDKRLELGMTPFLTSDEHHSKSFISGYTGFIPNAKKYIGEGYPTITRKALVDHAKESSRQKDLQNKPFNINKLVEVKPTATLYFHQTNEGLMPHYTGHVPGEKYKYGMTFGTTTRQAISEAVSQ